MTLLLAVLAVFVAAVALREVEIVRRMANGDPTALKTLYDAWGSRALGLAMNILRDRAEAEDVVQESFVELWRRAPQFDPARGGVHAWVATLVRSRALDRLRERGRSQRKTEGFASFPTVPVQDSPLELAFQREDRDRLHAAVSGLPIEQRQALELAYFEGLTHREIAEKTGQPLGTVKTRVRLAMGKLAAALVGQEGAA